MRVVEIRSSVGHPRLLALRGFIRLSSETGDPPAIVSNLMPGCSEDWLFGEDQKDALPPGWDPSSAFIIFYGVMLG
jgi:hypothetical protein